MKKNIFISLVFSILISEPITAQTKANNPFGNALIPDMIADASIQEIEGMFYCYATTDGYGQGLETSGPPVVWKSNDFVHWSFEGTYFPSAMKEKYWAPSKAIFANGKYYIYPTINGYMYPAVSNNPEGPLNWPAEKMSSTSLSRLLLYCRQKIPVASMPRFSLTMTVRLIYFGDAVMWLNWAKI